jgi:hypothetical protein
MKTEWFSSHVFQSFLRIGCEKLDVFFENRDFQRSFRDFFGEIGFDFPRTMIRFRSGSVELSAGMIAGARVFFDLLTLSTEGVFRERKADRRLERARNKTDYSGFVSQDHSALPDFHRVHPRRDIDFDLSVGQRTQFDHRHCVSDTDDGEHGCAGL